jgi:acyl-CoA hydrolase
MTPREQEIQRRTELSETRVAKAVFPPSTNHHNTLFGGTALAWMDEVSFIAATRFCRLPLVTVSRLQARDSRRLHRRAGRASDQGRQH